MKRNCFIERNSEGRFVPVLALAFAVESEDPDAVLWVLAKARGMSTREEAEIFIDANAPEPI